MIDQRTRRYNAPIKQAPARNIQSAPRGGILRATVIRRCCAKSLRRLESWDGEGVAFGVEVQLLFWFAFSAIADFARGCSGARASAGRDAELALSNHFGVGALCIVRVWRGPASWDGIQTAFVFSAGRDSPWRNLPFSFPRQAIAGATQRQRPGSCGGV